MLATPADAPFDAPADANGAQYRGQFYLFASNLRSAAVAQFALFHETLGHSDLRCLLGTGPDAELRGISNVNAGVRKAAATWQGNFEKAATAQLVDGGMPRAPASCLTSEKIDSRDPKRRSAFGRCWPDQH